MPWFIYSLLSASLFVGLYLCIRWLTDKGVAPKQILLFMVGFALLGRGRPFFLATQVPFLYIQLIPGRNVIPWAS